MVGASTERREELARWSAAAFVTAGLFRIVNMVLSNLGTFVDATSPEWALDLTLHVAFLAALAGVLALSPRMADRAPRLTRAGVVVVLVAAATQIVTGVAEYVIGAEQPPEPFGVLVALSLVLAPLGFLLFGAVSLRTRVPSRPVGALLLVVFVSYLVLFGGVALENEVLFRVTGVLFALATLGVGYCLRAASAPSDRAEAAPDSTA